MLTVTEAARRLGVKRITIQKWIERGKLKAVRFGPAWAINETDLHIPPPLRRGRKPSQGVNQMKTVTATLTGRNQAPVTVQLPNVPVSKPLTPMLARSAARIAFGHSDGVTITDETHGYQLTRNSARKIDVEIEY